MLKNVFNVVASHSISCFSTFWGTTNKVLATSGISSSQHHPLSSDNIFYKWLLHPFIIYFFPFWFIHRCCWDFIMSSYIENAGGDWGIRACIAWIECKHLEIFLLASGEECAQKMFRLPLVMSQFKVKRERFHERGDRGNDMSYIVSTRDIRQGSKMLEIAAYWCSL